MLRKVDELRRRWRLFSPLNWVAVINGATLFALEQGRGYQRSDSFRLEQGRSYQRDKGAGKPESSFWSEIVYPGSRCIPPNLNKFDKSLKKGVRGESAPLIDANPGGAWEQGRLGGWVDGPRSVGGSADGGRPGGLAFGTIAKSQGWMAG